MHGTYMYFALVKRYRFNRIFLFILNKCSSVQINLITYSFCAFGNAEFLCSITMYTLDA